MSYSNGQKDPMKPDELRNLFVFVVLATLIYFTYDAFVLKPQTEALKQANLVARQATEQAAGVSAADGPVVAGAGTTIELRPREEVLGETRRLEIDNGAIFGSLSLKGGKIDDLSFYEHFKTVEREDSAELLSPRGAAHARAIDLGFVSSDENVRLPSADSVWRVVGNDKLTHDNPVRLTWSNGRGLTFERALSIDEKFLITVEQKVTNNSGRTVTLFPFGLIAQTGLPVNFTGVYFMHEGPIGYLGDELAEIKYKTMRKEAVPSIQVDKGWIGVTDKYWLIAFIPPQGETIKYNFNYKGPEKDKKNIGRYQVDYVGEAMSVAPGQSKSTVVNLFTGAKSVLTLQNYGEQLEVQNFDLAVDFGIFWFMTKPFFYALHYLGLWIGNIGFAIIALTIIIRFAVFPLTNASYKSFAKMKKVAPQVAELREKYTDKKELQKELMTLYQDEGVNPMAGCLPMIVQIPIFFALYKTFYVTIEVRHQPFVGWIHDLSAPDPTSIFNLFGAIPFDPPGFLMIGVWPCMMLVAMIIQKKLNPPPQDPIQRDMANYFPFIMAFILAKFPAGLVIYWACSAWFGVAQQMFIMRRMGVPIHLFGETEAEQKIDDDLDHGGAAVHPLVDMAEDEVEEALFGDGDNDGEDNGKADSPKKKISKPKPKKSKKKK